MAIAYQNVFEKNRSDASADYLLGVRTVFSTMEDVKRIKRKLKLIPNSFPKAARMLPKSVPLLHRSRHLRSSTPKTPTASVL